VNKARVRQCVTKAGLIGVKMSLLAKASIPSGTTEAQVRKDRKFFESYLAQRVDFKKYEIVETSGKDRRYRCVAPTFKLQCDTCAIGQAEPVDLPADILEATRSEEKFERYMINLVTENQYRTPDDIYRLKTYLYATASMVTWNVESARTCLLIAIDKENPLMAKVMLRCVTDLMAQ
jgi:hypothetical protein